MKKILSYLLAALGLGVILLLFLQKPAAVIPEQIIQDRSFSPIEASPEQPPPATGDSIISADLIDGARHSAKFLRLESCGLLMQALIYSDDSLIQTITIQDTTDYEEYYFADCNFDGYRDLLIRNEETPGGPSYWVLDYNPKLKQYELNTDLSDTPGLHIDSVHKQIVIHNKFGYYLQSDDTFYYKDKEITFLKGTNVVRRDDDSLNQTWTFITRRQATAAGMITTVDSVLEKYD